MNIEKFPILQVSLKWGGILALGMILHIAINYVIGYESFNGVVVWVTEILKWSLAIFCLVKANIEYRNIHLQGYLKYSQAFASGLIVNIISNTSLAFFNYLFYEFFDKDFFKKSIIMEIDKINKNTLMPSEHKDSAILLAYEQTPLSKAIQEWWSSILILAFFMVFIAIFTKKKNSSFSETFKDVE
jgi:hypothetical protein